MKKEFILRVQMKGGAQRTFREWGWSAGMAFEQLKKDNPDVQYKIESKEA
ncbi:hypothetical protein ENKO_557 [Klebsiella phage fENko-Kae01]|nr:hypothetical protein [Klebsiella phage fENko-Kae01]WNV47653.1 hypothetical protein [Klebsiella phage fENko-Kae01]